MAQLSLAECDTALPSLPERSGSDIVIGDIAVSRPDLNPRLDSGHTGQAGMRPEETLPVSVRGLPCLTELSTSCLLAGAVGISILLWLAIFTVI